MFTTDHRRSAHSTVPLVRYRRLTPAHRIAHAPPMPHEHVVRTDIWLSQVGKHDMPPTRGDSRALDGHAASFVGNEEQR
ncbi:hypothetical protein C8R43DRAFT_1136878 [Mycena crocata]|nr:hypothetical protein C8R43DRAFT_1136878 [Mycena crocata]